MGGKRVTQNARRNCAGNKAYGSPTLSTPLLSAARGELASDSTGKECATVARDAATPAAGHSASCTAGVDAECQITLLDTLVLGTETIGGSVSALIVYVLLRVGTAFYLGTICLNQRVDRHRVSSKRVVSRTSARNVCDSTFHFSLLVRIRHISY